MEDVRNYRFKSGNYMQIFRDLSDVTANWDFLKEALSEMNDPARANMNENDDEFLKTVLHMVHSWPNAAAGILRSKSGKPLGFGAIYDSSSRFQNHRTLFVYATYSNGKYKMAVPELLEWTESFARNYGFHEILACTGRINGATFYWFEKKLKFRRRFIVFKKEL